MKTVVAIDLFKSNLYGLVLLESYYLVAYWLHFPENLISLHLLDFEI